MEAYPMPLFVKLSVNNMESSLNWYKEVLHFDSVFELPDGDGNTIMAHIRGNKYQDIMLVSEKIDQESTGKGIVLNFTVEDIESYAERASKMCANVIEGPIERPWNARELALCDPDGYVITLSMQIDQTKTMNDIVDQVKA